jgi:cytochrome c oxidase subunit 4
MSSITDPTPLHASQSPAPADHGHDAADHDDGKVHGDHSPYGLGHISSWQTLVKVWVALMVLTILTVMATWVNLGTVNIWIAMIIAVIKASLVVVYFMHMKHNKAFLMYVFSFSLAFVAFFLAMVMLDSKSYQPDIEKRRLDEIQVNSPPPEAAPATTTPTAPAKPAH